MRIRSIHIENFGKLHNYDRSFTPGMNTICAENGWGKSTLAAFIKAMFYGLDYTTKRSVRENERKHYLPWQGGAFGGSMEFDAGEKTYRVERFFGAKDKEDSFALYDLATGLPSGDYSERLGEELFSLDRNAYSRSSFFAQQDFAAENSDSLNSRLTRVEEAAGDMQNYEKAMGRLEERMRYYQKTGGRGQLDFMKKQRQDVLKELSECRDKEDALNAWKAKKEEKDAKAAALKEEISRLEGELAGAREYDAKQARRSQHENLRQQAEKLEEKLRSLTRELDAYEQIPAPEEELDECRSALYQLRTHAGEAQELEGKLEELKNRSRDEKFGGRRVKRERDIFLGAGAVLVFCGLILLPQAWLPMAAAIVITAIGFCGLAEGLRRGRQLKRTDEAEAERQEKSRQLRANLDRLRQEREKLLGKVRKTLRMPGESDPDKLEMLWSEERKRSREYAALLKEQERLGNEVTESRGAWLEFRQQFSSEELDSWKNLQRPERGCAELAADVDKRYRELEQLLGELRGMESQIRRLEEAAERVTELTEEEERLSREIEEGTKEFGILEKTAKYLKKAQEQFSTRYLKELQEGTRKYLARLSPENQVDAVVDVKLNAKVREAGAARDLEYFSVGSQDLVQLAERLAIVDALYEKEQPMLILDDPFVNLDTEKQRQALRLLQELSGTRQLLYFTCRENWI